MRRLKFNLANNAEECAALNGCALLDVHAGDLAGLRCHDLVFHLHSFEDHENLTFSNGIANIDVDGKDVAGHRAAGAATGAGAGAAAGAAATGAGAAPPTTSSTVTS